MNFLKKGLMIVCLLVIASGRSCASDSRDFSAWKLNGSYKGDFAANLNGGIKTGTTYLGLADLFLSFDTGIAGWWKGGRFLVYGVVFIRDWSC